MKIKSLRISLAIIALLSCMPALQAAGKIKLNSKLVHKGDYVWKMVKAGDAGARPEEISTVGFATDNWLDAVVPGTVLTSLVKNEVYPDPYYGINNKMSENKIPDLDDAGRDFYTYWFRTEFDTPEHSKGQHVWLQPDGINYRAEFWLNGRLLYVMAGMFAESRIDITDYVVESGKNALAVLVFPVDFPGRPSKKRWGAMNENRNGGNGLIGKNVTQLMTAGWDFYYDDGIRDRNTGIWKTISLYVTGPAVLRSPFVKSSLNSTYDQARQTVSVDVLNATDSMKPLKCELSCSIGDIHFSKKFEMGRGMHSTITFTPEEFKELVFSNPRLWWPKNKGAQNLYTLKMELRVKGVLSDTLSTRFGIREIKTTRETPDSSKLFIVNGRPIFINGSNWLPEAMQRTSDERMEAEIRYTAQSGINLLRLWGGGIAESDRFYELCDEYGILVWQEFWMTGDTRHPIDENLYLGNVEATVKRIRNHPSLVFYVASNESTEVTGTPELLARLDGTRPYQMQSECDGIHDGSPYLQVNPMQHYENTASRRGSRLDGFNPEYGAPTIPLASSLKEMMPSEHLWPINKEVWDYLDGNGFHKMTTVYKDLTNEYGESDNIDEYAFKGQLVGAINSKSIWETWNYNKLGFGDRWCSGLLFWYHNVPAPLVCARMWDYSLEPTASLYHTMHSLEPLHVQFDYLKNTVSVVNDYPRSFDGCKVTATIYDLNSKIVSKTSAMVNVREEATENDVIKLDFPASITPVHFISLVLKDSKGSVVSRNFYWRSNNQYQGPDTISGPCSAGFQSLSDMPKVKVTMKVAKRIEGGNAFYDVTLRNTSSKIAFFNQIQLFNGDGKSVRPSYYSDNFVTLLPKESIKITVETKNKGLSGEHFVLKGWNTRTK